MIFIIGGKIRDKILDDVRKNKYYSIIVNHPEQMPRILRYVSFNENNESFEVKESFIQFVECTDKTGKGIADKIFGILDSLKLNINDLGGQGYDSGSNMKGKDIGVQRLILDKYSFFVLCCDHSLNLVVNDTASASGEIF